MQDENRFFRFLGRVNAVLLTLCGLGVLLLLGGLAFSSLFWRGFEAPVAIAHGPAAIDTPEYSYNFGGSLSQFESGTLTVLDGTNEAMMVLRRTYKTSEGSLSGRYSPEETVNIMIIDLGTAHTRWLFKGTHRNIGTSYLIRGAAVSGKSAPVLGLLLTVAEVDTDGDGKFDSADETSLYLYRPGAARAEKILPAKAISNIAQPDPGKVVVTYYDGKDDRIVFLSTADFKPVVQGIISATPR